MQNGQHQKEFGEHQGHRISRKTANLMFSIYILCLTVNFFIAVYYALKLGWMLIDSSQSLKSTALYFYHSKVFYADALPVVYFFWVRRFYGREIKECDQRWGAIIRENTPS